MKKIVILTEGNKKVGFGHVARCFSLSTALVKLRCEVEMFVNGDSSISSIVKRSEYKQMNWLKTPNMVKKILSKADACIVDSYLAKKSDYSFISNNVKVLACFDDNNRLDYGADIVINGNMHASKLKYKKNRRTKYLLGSKFLCLRKEFNTAPKKIIRKNIRRILITAGGSNLNDLLIKIVEKLRNKHEKVDKVIVVGEGFKKLKTIKNFMNKKMKLKLGISAKEFKELMISSDIAISAGGQTICELARIGVPTIAFVTAENQRGTVAEWNKSGFVRFAGDWKDEEKTVITVLRIIDELADFKTREKMSLIGKKYVDGKGASRVAKVIYEAII